MKKTERKRSEEEFREERREWKREAKRGYTCENEGITKRGKNRKEESERKEMKKGRQVCVEGRKRKVDK